jgi:hypothetical protein
VSYDEELAHRIRALIGPQRGLREQKMFGGLAFLIGGHMAIAASRQGGVLVRVDPQDSDRLVASTTATLAVMSGRPTRGWLRVEPDEVRTKAQLSQWVALGTDFARSLPAKR